MCVTLSHYPATVTSISGLRTQATNKQQTDELRACGETLRGPSEYPKHGGLGGGVGGSCISLVTGVGGGGVAGGGGEGWGEAGQGAGQAVQPQAPKGGRGERVCGG